MPLFCFSLAAVLILPLRAGSSMASGRFSTSKLQTAAVGSAISPIMDALRKHAPCLASTRMSYPSPAVADTGCRCCTEQQEWRGSTECCCHHCPLPYMGQASTSSSAARPLIIHACIDAQCLASTRVSSLSRFHLTCRPAAGAVLSHGNLIANAAGSAALMAQQGAWGPGDTHLSFLPLAHIFERKNLTLALHYGLAIGFYSGDARRVFEDAAVLRPSLLMAVPRVFNRLHDEVMAEVKQGSALRRRLFQAAYARKAAALEAGGWWCRTQQQAL